MNLQENFRQIHERVADRLLDTAPEYEQMPLNFHLTSVYDHSLHEAFSRVLHRLIDSMPFLEALLNVFCAVCVLFYKETRGCLIIDSFLRTRNHPKHFFLTSSHDCILQQTLPQSILRRTTYAATTFRCSTRLDHCTGMCQFRVRHRTLSDDITILILRSTTASSSRYRRPETPITDAPSTQTSSTPKQTSLDVPLPESAPPAPPKRRKELFYPSAATSLLPSTPGTTLTYHLITPNLALLALIPTAVFETRRGLLEYNVVFFREGVQEICDVEREARRVADN